MLPEILPLDVAMMIESPKGHILRVASRYSTRFNPVYPYARQAKEIKQWMRSENAV